MDILVLESSPRHGVMASASLERAGHRVVRCPDGSAGPTSCPLEAREIGVALIAGDHDALGDRERCGMCAARHRVPILTVPCESLVATGGDDLVAAIELAAGSGVRDGAAVVRDLLSLGVISRNDLEGLDPACAISVERSKHRLMMTIWVRPGSVDESLVVKTATEALRRECPGVTAIDVHLRHRD